MRFTASHRACRLAVGLGAALIVFAGAAAAAEEDDVDAASFPQVETKLKKLKKRVKQLESQVATLETLNLPATVDVNCAGGSTIGSALEAYAQGSGFLTINVTGLCVEHVVIARSNVLLQGQSADAGVQTAAGFA